MIDHKHKPTLDRLRELGVIRAEGWMIVAGDDDPWRIGTAFGGIPGTRPDELVALIADLLNDALRDTLNA